MPFLRVSSRFARKNHHKTCFKQYFNEYHQNYGNSIDFHRVFIFPGCPGQVGRTDEISVFVVFCENWVLWSNWEKLGTLGTWLLSNILIRLFWTAKTAWTSLGAGGPDPKCIIFCPNSSFKSYFTTLNHEKWRKTHFKIKHNRN